MASSFNHWKFTRLMNSHEVAKIMDPNAEKKE